MRLRRKFLKQLLALGGGLSFTSFTPTQIPESLSMLETKIQNTSSDDLLEDEKFWYQIKQLFSVSSNTLNLNNAGVSSQPIRVQDAFDRYNRIANENPALYVTRSFKGQKNRVRDKLAVLAGCSEKEIAIQRNATEALYCVLFGMTWKPGDEIVLCKQDYSALKIAWEQLAERQGVKLVWVDLDLPEENKEKLINAFTQKFTSKTKLVQITHMINWTGQILPVREICRKAKQQGIKTLVDGAQTFGHLDFKIPDLECDFFATSLHKWLCAPFGTGLLYVKKECISDIYSLFPSPKKENIKITKFEHLGTTFTGQFLAIEPAIDLHNIIGNSLKESRLRYLKNYLCEKVKKHPKIHLNTSLMSEFSCGIAHFSIDGVSKSTLRQKIVSDYKITMNYITLGKIQGIRVSPQIYITKDDIDYFVKILFKVLDDRKHLD